jgi:RHS repeat-associated protein
MGHGLVMAAGRCSWVRILGFALALGGGNSTAGATTQPGAIPDNFSVSAVGAANYQIPIELPPGVNGLKPSLSLLYNSQEGAGQLGIGWSLTGLSVIVRCPQTTAQDQNTFLPQLSLNDRFCLDSSRLILTSGSYGAAGSTYRTEIESFQQVTAHGTAGNGPSYFTVVDRAGLTRTYSTQLMRSGGTTAMEWLLTSATDQHGNYISLQYNITQPQQGGVWQEIAEIDYGFGYTGPNTGTPVGRVIFSYGSSGDPYSQYFAHTSVGVNMALLKSIAIEDGGGGALREYRLTYNSLPDPSNTVSLNELASVEECAGFNYATCFNPTTFSYNGAFTSFGGGNTLGNVTMGYLQVADLDGDGLPDYVYEVNNQVYVTFGNQNGNSIFVVDATTKQGNPGIAMGNGVPIDLYGDGKQEMLVPFYPQPGGSNNQPYWKVLSWNGQTGSGAGLRLTAFPVGPPSANDPAHSGTVDAVAVDPLNVGQQGLLFVSNRQLAYYPNVNGTLSSTPAAIGNIPALDVNAEPPVLVPVNFSGSGQAEVYVAGNGIAYWNSADGQFELEKAGSFDDANSKLVFVDNNGDGLTGVFEADQGNFWFWPNAGDGTGFRFQSSSSGAVYTCNIPAGYDTTQMLAVDWYHDGRQEVLIPVNGKWYLVTFNAQASNPCAVKPTGIALQPGQQDSQLLDVNGDGQFDMVYTDTASGTFPTQYLLNGGEAFTLNQVTDGLGHNIDVGYSPVDREVYVTGMAPGGAGPEIQSYSGSLQVVKDFAVDTGTLDGSGNPQQVFTYYLYGGAAVDTWGRGFLGFAQVEAINYNSKLYNTVAYEQAFPFTGLVDSETKSADPVAAPRSASLGSGNLHVSCSNLSSGEPVCNISSPPAAPAATWITGGIQLSVTTNCYTSNPNNCQGNINQVIQTYNGVYYPVALSSTKKVYDLNTGDNFETIATRTHYSQISNTQGFGVDYMPDDVTVTHTDNTSSGQANDDVSKAEKKTVYADDSSNAPEYAPNCPGRPEKLTVTDTFENVTAQSKVENFTYDAATCFLTSDSNTISDPAGIVPDQTLTKTYTPDSYGNTIKVLVTGGGLPSAGRTTTTTYDITGRFPVYVTNSLSQTATLGYDAWGHKISDTDANRNTVTYGYSVLGLLKVGSGPQSGVTSSWAYSGASVCSIDCVPSSVPMTMDTTQTNSDGSVSMTQTDELNRSLRVVKTGFAGEYVLQDTQYDMLGRVVMTTLPYKDSTTPHASCEDIRTYDLLNRVTKEVQPYKTNADGSCITRTITIGYSDFTTTKTITDNASNAQIPQEVTVTTLNVLAEPISVTDSNSGIGGTTSYTYDPWGNLTKVTSPDGGLVKMGYDSAGHKLSMTDPDMGSWTYRYDALGELTSQTDANGNAVANTYDALGRLVERDEAEDRTFWKYDVAYGAGIGRLAYTYSTQPDGTLGSKNAWEGYAYDVYGEATDKITLVNGQEYWVTTTYDGLGRPSQLVYPDMNGINANGKPATPAGLNAVVDPNDAAQIDVTWTLAKSGQIYHLYRTLSTASQPTAADEIYAGPTSAWADDTLTVDGSYTWWLSACNGDSDPAGQETGCSGYAEVTLNNIVLPPTVPGVPTPPSEGVQTSTTWPVTWLASSLGVTNTAPPISYNLQYSYTTDGSSPTTTTTTITGVSVTSASESAVSTAFQGLDGQYVFRVQACAAHVCSMYSAWSGSYNLIVQPSAPWSPSVPGVATPNTSPGPIPASWGASVVSGGPVTYKVYVASVSASGTVGSYALSGSVTSSAAPYANVSYSDTESQDGYYAYYVLACDSNSTGVCSAPAYTGGNAALTLPPTPPGRVTGSTTDSHSTGWTVTWAASTATGGPAADISVVYYLQEFLNGTLINTYYTGNNSYYTGGHTQDGTYTYRVMGAATDSTVDSGKDMAKTSWVSSSYAYTTVIAPAFPVNVSASGTSNLDGSFTVTWSEPNTAGHATSYTGVLGEWDIETQQYFWIDGHCNQSDATPTSCTATTHTGGMLYVKMEACNTDNAVENGVTACSGDSAIAGPVNSTIASPPTLSGGGNSPSGTGTLTWTAVPGVGHYEVFAAYESASTGTWGAYNDIANVTGTSRAVSLTSAQAVGHYYVEACDSVSCTAASNMKAVTYTVPAAPSLSGTSNDPPFALSWSVSTGATTYEVYKDAYNGTWTGWALYDTVNAPTHTDSVNASVRATEVDIYVVACNPMGCSSHSDELDITVNLCGSSCTSSIWPPAKFDAEAAPVLLATTDLISGPPLPASHLQGVQQPPRPVPYFLQRTTVFAMRPRPASFAAVKPMPALHPRSLTRLPSLQASVARVVMPELSARQAFLLAHAQARSNPEPVRASTHRKRATLLAAEWAGGVRPAPAIDPRLSMYPPLRKDSRVLAHFEAMGGQLPVEIHQVDCVGAGTGGGDSDTGGDCSQPGSNALMIGYVYNSVGALAEVDKLNTVNGSVVQAKAIWQGLDATAAGQIDLEGFDNAPTAPGAAMPTTTAGATFSTSTTYDPISGLMTAATGSAVNAGDTVNATYAWDGYNNLLGRTMGETIASSQTQPPGLSESFTYDPLNRLISTTTNSGTPESYGYQPNDGELTSKGVFSDYRYDQAGSCNGTATPAHLHAVARVTTSDGNRAFAYDANGNLVCESGDVNRAVTWSSFNKPTHIQGDSATEDFTYGPAHERLVTAVNKQVNGSADQVTTVYIDGVFESAYDSESGTYTYRHYVVVGGARVAVETITANNGEQQTGDALSFFVHDQVGSVIAEVTENEDSTNQQMALMSYDAWGKARPTGGSPAWQPLAAGSFMDPSFAGQYEGFGQHENLDDVGLVDMEGRVYDPETGTFLSADPTVQFPFSSQGYDRYVYVNNNPLSFSDPSGYSLVGDVVGAGAVVGAAGTVIGTSVGIATAVGGTVLGPAIGNISGNWIDQHLNPQEFSVLNMITSDFCGPFYALCYGANTYNYERANSVPVDHAIPGAVASGIEAYASQRSTAIFNDGNWLGAAAVAYAGGYTSARVDGGDGSLGGDRALGQLALLAAMDELDSRDPSLDTTDKPGMIKITSGPGPGQNTGIAINGDCMDVVTCSKGLTTDQVEAMPKNSPIAVHLAILNPKTMFWNGKTWEFSEISEGGYFMEFVNHHLAGAEAFSEFHDWWMSAAKNSAWIMGTIPFAAYATYMSLGGYTQYYLVRSPGQYH